MKVLDQAVMAIMRRVRRRRREREVAELTLPGLEGYTPPEASAEAHVGERRGAGGKLARRRSLRMAVAAIVVSATVGFPAYLAGSSVAEAAASEEAEEAAYEETLAEYEAAQSRENAALDAAVAAFSAERASWHKFLPEELAVSRLQEEHDLSEAEAEDVVAGERAAAGLENAIGITPTEKAAIDMWEASEPETEVVQERIQAYEAAVEEAEAAKTDYEAELDRAID